MKDLGVNEDTFRLFISEIYNHSKDIGLQPEYIAYNTKQILDLIGSIPLSQIPSYIQEKNNEKRKLEENITRLGDEELAAKAGLHQALNEKKVYLAELEQFSSLKIELDKLGISLEDVQHFVRTIQGVRQLGYSVDSIARVVSNLEGSSRILAEIDNNIKDLTVSERDLKEEYDRLETLTSVQRQKLSAYEQLRDMGCGLKELKLLFSTIKEVSAENKIHDTVAVKMFFGDIERNYDTKLGYESKILVLKSEIDKQNQELNTLQKVLAFRNKIARTLGELIYFGFDDQELLNLAWALQSNISIKESLEEDLKKYGSLKKLIEALDQESRKLEGQNKPVEAESDYVNIPKDELDEVREMQERGAIAPLIRAARGELVEFNQLKRAVIGGIDIALESLASDKQASDAFKSGWQIINKSHRQIA